MTSPEANRTGAERKAIIEAAIQALEQGEVMLTPREAARAIGCGERWLRDGANHRGFPHHRFGKFLRFSLQDCREIREIHRAMARPSALAKARRRKATTRKSTGSGPATPASVRLKPVA
ncbi:hypothetical protein QQM39_38715 [Streptomyces sp. DT2A-34]|uniref:hypothetical protein n=1 Tax=Streptomyces sp. DT2A-34 TaxID=3051182 RepID=UPI00265BF799|nr:hypothetical protein [Streptomyces sp. DT2A-34]MDO0916547.1 hypothetical protein [Streptomyces sp. DT2A-34]